MEPESVKEIKIRAQRRQGLRCAADEESQQVILVKLPAPVGKTDNLPVHHQDQRTENLWLVFSGTTGPGIKGSEKLHNRIQIKEPEFFPCGGKFGRKPFA